VPRQALLHKLDPSGGPTVPAVSTRLEPLVQQYKKLILHDQVEAGMTLKDALKINNYFHQLRRAQSWGEICVSCTCRVCCAICLCKTRSSSYPCSSRPYVYLMPGSGPHPPFAKGAGRSRVRPGASYCNEKVINSKVRYLQGSGQTPASPPELSIPSHVLPTSLSSESDSDDDDFVNVKVRMASWAALGLSILTKYVVRRSSRAPGGRGSPAARRDRPTVRQSAYHCTCCSYRAGLSLIVRPTIDGAGSFETARNNETAGTHMLYFFQEQRPLPPETTHFPTLSCR
jgi:hypothetical protein